VPPPQQEQQDAGQEQAGPASGGPGLNHRCDHCSGAAAPGRRLLLCTRCRESHYCSAECQAAAWGGHRRACTAAMKRRLAGQPPAPAAASGAAAAAAAGDDAAGGGAVGGGAAAKQESAGDPGTKQEDVLAAIGSLLQRHADGAADTLQAALEAAVARFVRGDYGGAAPALQEVSAAARAAGRLELSGDALRWLGHAHNRLGAPARAAAAFAEGAEVATAAGSKRLQVDCLSGLGAVARAQAQSEAAVGYLRQALAVADTVGPGGGPMRAGVLTNLGTALMPVDAAEARERLKEAVELREAQVTNDGTAGRGGGRGRPGLQSELEWAAKTCSARAVEELISYSH
jgi:tetratricopeptide (TPR) repeat protein